MKRFELRLLIAILVGVFILYITDAIEDVSDILSAVFLLYSVMYFFGGYFIFKPKKKIKSWKLLAVVSGLFVSSTFFLVFLKIMDASLTYFFILIVLLQLSFLFYLTYRIIKNKNNSIRKSNYIKILIKSSVVFLFAAVITLIPKIIFVKYTYGSSSEVYYNLVQYKLLDEAYELRENGNVEQAKNKLNKAIHYSEVQHDVSSIILQKCINELAYVNYLLGDFNSSDSVVNITLNLYKYDYQEDIKDKYDASYQKVYFGAIYTKALLYSGFNISYLSDSLFSIALNYYVDNRSLSYIYHRLGNNQSVIGNYIKADSLYSVSINHFKKINNEGETNLWAEKDMAINTIKMLDFDRAESIITNCYNIAKTEFGINSIEVAKFLDVYIQLNIQLADYDKAEKYCLESMRIKILHNASNSTSYFKSSMQLASIYLATSNFPKADSLLMENLWQVETYLDKRSPGATMLYDMLSTYNSDIMNFEQSQFYAEKSLTGKIYWFGEYGINVAISYHNLASALYYQSNYYQADSLYRISLDIKRDFSGYYTPNYAASMNGIALVYIELDSLETAKEYLDYCLEFYEDYYGVNHPNYATALMNSAYLKIKQNNIDAAEKSYLEALNIFVQTYNGKNIKIASIYYELGNLWVKRNQINKAIDYYLKSSKTYESLLGSDHYFVKEIKQRLKQLVEEQNAIKK